jgi:uncharacterized membrane protein
VSDLIAISYPDINQAERVMDTLGRMTTEHLLELDDAVYVTKDADGKIKLHQSVNPSGTLAAGGGMWGGLWGLLLGALVLAPVAGLVIGAGIGAGSGFLAGKLSDFGVDDNFIRELSNDLTPNSSAIIALVRRATPEKALAEVSKYGGHVLHTSLAPDAEQRIQEALTHGGVLSPQMQPPTDTAATAPQA